MARLSRAAKPIPATTGDTLTVANKLPYALTIRVHRFVEQTEISPGGSTRSVNVAVPADHPLVVINGNAFREDKGPRGHLVGGPGGYALTHGVPADIFNEWLSQNRDSEAVKKGLIFAAARPSHAEGKANEQFEIRTGLERLDGDHLEKHGIFDVKKADR